MINFIKTNLVTRETFSKAYSFNFDDMESYAKKYGQKYGAICENVKNGTILFFNFSRFNRVLNKINCIDEDFSNWIFQFVEY